jgi:hypothetical protein
MISLFLSSNVFALAEFGTLHSSSAGQVVITVDDGNPIKRYCIVEVTVQDKKIRWISHPLSEAFVKRDPKFIHDFDKTHLLIGSISKNEKDNTNAQLHLYTKGEQTLDLLAETECTERAEIKVENKAATFMCGSKAKTIKYKTPLSAQIKVQFPAEPILFKDKVYEVKDNSWRFEIAETDDYFKDRLLIVQKNQVLKEYKAKDFMRCFEYETLKGSQDKFTE